MLMGLKANKLLLLLRTKREKDDVFFTALINRPSDDAWLGNIFVASYYLKQLNIQTLLPFMERCKQDARKYMLSSK